MKVIIFVAITFLGAINCSPSKSVYSHGTGSSYSSAGLRTIAQGSANQAHSAAASQHAAAHQASYVAKSTLAQTATQAAATAQAALAGKKILLANLEEQVGDASHRYHSELEQLKISQIATAAAAEAAKLASSHVAQLSAALNSAQSAAAHAEESAQKAATELASQISMVTKAKGRLQGLQHQFNSVLLEFGATQEAAEKATSSAHEAQANAAEAGSQASIGLHQSAEQQSAGHDDDISKYTQVAYVQVSHGHK